MTNPPNFKRFLLTDDEQAQHNDAPGHDNETGFGDEPGTHHNGHESEREPWAGMLIRKSANEWIERAKSLPYENMIFDRFWAEGELCVLFATTNVGKSLLAVQIADDISRGRPTLGLKTEIMASKVLYFDFELTVKQFEGRYAAKDELKKECYDHYVFNDNLQRIEVDVAADLPKGLSILDGINESIKIQIMESGAKILIVDNLTYLSDKAEKAQDALPLMKYLQTLKRQYGLSILALAHTPKRDASKPITLNDLQGSSMVSNFLDSAFCIGKSATDPSVRYLKQIKQRRDGEFYGIDNVLTCQINKTANFTGFEILENGTTSEYDHLKQISDSDKESQTAEIMQLHQRGFSFRQIGDQLGISHMKAKRAYDSVTTVTACNRV